MLPTEENNMKRNFDKSFCNRNNYPEELFESKDFEEFNERSQNLPVQWVLDYAKRIFEGVRDFSPDDEAPYFQKAWTSANEAYINALEFYEDTDDDFILLTINDSVVDAIDKFIDELE